MKQLSATIFRVLQDTSELTVDELLAHMSEFWRASVREQLTILWKDGKLYASEVEQTPSGYTPTHTARWSATKLDGYYGFKERTGLFRITSKDTQAVTLKLEATLSLENPLYTLAVSPDGNDFVVGDRAGSITIGSIQAGSFKKTVSAHKERIWALSYTPDGSAFASGSQDGRIILWSADGRLINVVGEVDEWVTSLDFSPDGMYILSGHRVPKSVGGPAVLRRWSVERPQKNEPNTIYTPNRRGNIYCAAYLPNGEGILLGGSDSTVRYYSFHDRQITVSDKHSGTVFCLRTHPTLPRVATGGQYGTIKIWDFDDNSIVQSIEAHTSRVTSLTISPDGKLLASAGKDSRIAVWRWEDGTLVADMLAHSGWVRAVSFGQNRETLISGGSDGLCKIWRLAGYPEQEPITD